MTAAKILERGQITTAKQIREGKHNENHPS